MTIDVVTSPRVSVVVPVRNRRGLLRQLLDALAAQTLADHEVIVVDDGSTDGSADEAEADARAGRPVRLLRLAGGGAVAARTAGAAEARAAILAFTDSDCVPEPRWLEAGVAAVERGADVVQGATRPRRPCGPLERTVTAGDDGLYATCNVFYRRDAFDAAGGFDRQVAAKLGFRFGARSQGLGFGEDTLLGWRVRRAGRAAFVPEAVVEHEVFAPDLVDTLSRAVMAGAFPALVGEVPELRATLLSHRALLGTGRLPLYGAGVAALAGRRRAAAGLLALWASRHWRAAAGAGPARRPAVAAALAGLDVVTGAALVAGSVRTGQVVL